MAKPLDALLELVASRDAVAKLYFVGDYVNRGPDSRSVIDRLLALAPGSARFVRGNHDDILDQILHGEPFAPNAAEGHRLVALRWFLQYGLDATLSSYGADAARVAGIAKRASDVSALDELIALIPPAHRAFIHSLEPMIDEADLFVAHGNWNPRESDATIAERLSIDPDARRRLLWRRFGTNDITNDKAWKRVGYFGHTPVDLYPELLPDSQQLVPIEMSNIRLIDTAAALLPHGRLTAYCHEESTFLQVDREGRFIDNQT